METCTIDEFSRGGYCRKCLLCRLTAYRPFSTSAIPVKEVGLLSDHYRVPGLNQNPDFIATISNMKNENKSLPKKLSGTR